MSARRRPTQNSEMDRIARAQARNKTSKRSPSHRSRKQQRDRPTDANPSSKTGTQISVPHERQESDNRKARESRGPAPGSLGPARRGQARLEKQSAQRLPSPPARQGQTHHDPSNTSPPGKGKRITTQAKQARPARANASRRKQHKPARPGQTHHDASETRQAPAGQPVN